MIIETNEGWKVLVLYPDAVNVCLVNDFRWHVTVTSMRCREEDGLWEAPLPDHVRPARIAFYVRQANSRCGYLNHHDVSPHFMTDEASAPETPAMPHVVNADGQPLANGDVVARTGIGEMTGHGARLELSRYTEEIYG